MANECTHIVNLLSRTDIRLNNEDLDLTEHGWEKIRSEWADVGLTLARLKMIIQAKDQNLGDEYKDLKTVQIDSFTEAMKVLK